MKLSNQPYKGTMDYLPEDFQKLKYIFDTWRKVASKYAYKEYLTPVLEHLEIYQAKSGEDINREMYLLEDSGGRKLAMRPEMTPSVTRLVTQFYNGAQKPIRLFSIANFFRGETPQKGRYREFWQLNMDIFGEISVYADLEIIQSALDLMLEFGAGKSQFILKLNHRKLINFLLENILEVSDENLKTEIVRKLDKYKKLSTEDFAKVLTELGLNENQITNIQSWMNSSFEELEDIYSSKGISEDLGFQETRFLLQTLQDLGYGDFVEYSTELIRGFDYYDGSIFEVFDLNPNFSRSLFGGGRYNGLANIFGSTEIPAVGYAPGSPISIFLDNWNLWPDFNDKITNIYVPLLLENPIQTFKLVQDLRQLNQDQNTIYELGTSITTFPKAITTANKRNFEKVILLGEDELAKGVYILKDMRSGGQEEVSLVNGTK